MSGANIKVSADTKDYEKGVKNVKDGFKEVTKEASTFGKIASNAVSSFIGNLSANIVSSAFSKITNGFRSAIAQGREFISLSEQQDEAVRAFNLSLANTGQFTEQNSKEFQGYASELQNLSRVGDEVILKNASIIQSLGRLDKDGLKRATKAALDLSEGLQGVSFEQASQLVGRAADGNVTALQRLGIQIKSTGDDAKDFETVLQELEKRFGGSAQAAIFNFTGATAQASNIIGDLKESLGALVTQNPAVVTGIQEASKAFTELQGFINENKETLQGLVTDGFLLLVDGSALVINAISGISSAFLSARQAYLEYINATEITRLESQLASLPQQLDAQGKKIETFYEQGLIKRIAALKGEREEERKSYEDRQKLLSDFQAKVQELQERIKVSTVSGTDREIENLQDLSKRSLETQEQLQQDKLRLEQEFNEEFLTVRLDYIRSILGEEEALREESRARELAAQGNFQAAAASISAAEVKARKSDILTIQKFEALSQRERLSNLQSTLGQIAALQSSSSNELFFIGKSAAIATATIDGLLAVQRALASAPPPINFALAGVVGAATAANISKIASQKPTGAFDGALVDQGSIFSDTQPFMLSKGEVVAPRKDFDDVVEGTARQRGFVKRGEEKKEVNNADLRVLAAKIDGLIETLRGPDTKIVEIQLTDNLIEFVEQGLRERKILGIAASDFI